MSPSYNVRVDFGPFERGHFQVSSGRFHANSVQQAFLFKVVLALNRPVAMVTNMASLNYVTHQRINLKDHPVLNERWVQDRIAEAPSILGLGDLILKDKERNQPKAGRLDILLQDADSNSRYEVEIQL